MHWKPLILAVGISISSTAYSYADINTDLDSLIAWTMEKPDRTELIPFDKAGMYEPHIVFTRSTVINRVTYQVTFTDRGSLEDSTYIAPDGKRGNTDLLVFQRTARHTTNLSPGHAIMRVDRRTYHDEGADGMVYGTPDFIDGPITVKMNEEGLARQEFVEYERIYKDAIKDIIHAVKK